MRGLSLAFAGLVTLASACGDSPPPPESLGAVRVNTTITDAQFFVDALARGPVTNGAVVELPAGHHVLEARRGGSVIASASIEIRAAMLLDVALAANTASLAASDTRAGEVVTPPPASADEVVPHEADEPAPIDPNAERRAHYGEPAPGTLPPGRQPSGLQQVMARERASLQRCYERAQRSLGPQTDMNLTVVAEIAPSGRVESASIEGDAPSELATCLRRAVRAWRFDAAPDTSTVRFPLIFRGAAPSEAPPAARPDPGLDLPRAPAADPLAGPLLPASPARGELAAAMRALQRDVAACAEGAHGRATIQLTFGSSGAPLSATVASEDLTPSQQSCVASAARAARVSPFTQPSMRVSYPFVF